MQKIFLRLQFRKKIWNIWITKGSDQKNNLEMSKGVNIA